MGMLSKHLGLHCLLPRGKSCRRDTLRELFPAAPLGGPTSVCSKQRQRLREHWPMIEPQPANWHVHGKNDGKSAAIVRYLSP